MISFILKVINTLILCVLVYLYIIQEKDRKVKKSMLSDLSYYGINVANEYKDILLHSHISYYEIDEVEVGKLIVCAGSENGWCKTRTFVGSDNDPQYQYLIGNKKYYKNRLDSKESIIPISFKHKKKIEPIDIQGRSFTHFNYVIKSVKENKYDYHKAIIVVDKDNVMLDGAHRASIVCFNEGCNKKIKVLRIFNSWKLWSKK